MRIPGKLLSEYNTPVPRYTSYPPANYFHEKYGEKEFVNDIIESNEKVPQNISLYIHIPFCNRICHYCGCNSMKIRDEGFTRSYLEAIKKELMMFRKLLSKNRKVSQIHWGGGTPNSLPASHVSDIMQLIHAEFELTDAPEIAIECNPAGLDEQYIDGLYNDGFNRISLGVQDFNTEVLKAVNREIPAKSIVELMNYIRKSGKMKINLDFIYGLPLQEVNSFRDTIQQAASLRPDRLVTFSYAHVPWFRPNQKKLEKYDLPTPDKKIAMFEAAGEVLKNEGYRFIGLDHYALPNDELSIALEHKQLHRNFQGYCTRETTGQVYASGISSISQLYGSYAQNTKNIKDYIKTIGENHFPVEKGYSLSPEEIIIREVINEIMCNKYISWKDIQQKTGKTKEQLLQLTGAEEKKLQKMEEDELLVREEESLEVTEMGSFFIRNIASAFDPGIKNREKKFSRSV